MSTETKQKPVLKVQVSTAKVAIWRHTGEKGPYYTTSLSVDYKDGDEWKTSKSYGPQDLVNIATAALMARSEIFKFIRADKKAAGEQVAEDGDGE